MSTKRLRAARNGTLNNNIGKKSGLVSRIGRSGTFRWFKVNKDCCNPIIVNIVSVVATNARQIRITFNNPHGLTSSDGFILKREGGDNLTIGSDGDFANANYILLPITPNLNGSGVLDETSKYTLSYNGDKIATSTNNNVDDIKNLDISSVFIDTTDKDKLYVNFKTDLSKTSVLDISQTDLFNVSSNLLTNTKIVDTDISNNLGNATDDYKDVNGSIILDITAANPTTEIDISYGTYIPDNQNSFQDSSGSIFANSNGKYWIVGKGVDNSNVHVYNHIRTTLESSSIIDVFGAADGSSKLDISLNFNSAIKQINSASTIDISYSFTASTDISSNNAYIPVNVSYIGPDVLLDISGNGLYTSLNTWRNQNQSSTTGKLIVDISGVSNIVATNINQKYLMESGTKPFIGSDTNGKYKKVNVSGIVTVQEDINGATL